MEDGAAALVTGEIVDEVARGAGDDDELPESDANLELSGGNDILHISCLAVRAACPSGLISTQLADEASIE